MSSRLQELTGKECPQRMESSVKHIALFVIDGLRPDGLQQADTPVMDGLMTSGVHTLQGRTVMPSVTLPCHMSLFLGVNPGRHGITTNLWTPQVRPVPGLIDVIRQAGGSTSAFYSWEPLRDIARPGALDASFFLNNCHDAGGAGDSALADLAAGWLGQHTYTFSFVYFGYVDIAGHDDGFTSEPYRQAIANADRCIGQVMTALPPECAVIVTTDHGGHEQSHGTDCDEDMTIPLVLSGPGFATGGLIEGPVQITDVAPTVLDLLGLAPPKEWIGSPIRAE